MLSANTRNDAEGLVFATWSAMRIMWIVCCAVLLSTAAEAQEPVSDVLTVQVRLDRAGFSPGEIDGRSGANTRRAIAAFQQAHQLPSSGQLDSATQQALVAAAGDLPTLMPYTITPGDVDGPFAPEIPADMMEKAKLKALGYTTAVEALAEKFHASPALLRRLNPKATFARAGEEIQVPHVEAVGPPPRAETTRRGRGPTPRGTTGTQDVTIYVTMATSALTIEDSTGRVIFHAPVTSGSEHDPLPIGQWKVTRVDPSPTFNYNPALFWDADPAHAKARIAPGPNNPVGTVWIDLSKEHYGIHGTPEPSRIGYTQSHGCVRLTNWDIQRVARWAAPGTPVIFR
jgi:lipoprotein-anchoring transpeptidase ErfK/SrfK